MGRQACRVACLCVSGLNQKCLILSHKFSIFAHKQILVKFSFLFQFKNKYFIVKVKKL